MNYQFRPIEVWPGSRTERPKRSLFRAGYQNTLDLLETELGMLDADHVVIQLAIEEADLRLDGMLRANTKPDRPGVILSFDSKYGPLRYPCGTFDDWTDNLRAIALGLEALRKVDRYGVTRRGEQYTGWRQLTAGTDSGPYTRQEAAWVVASAAEDTWSPERILGDSEVRRLAVRKALKLTHPDQGGDPEKFGRVQRARELLG